MEKAELDSFIERTKNFYGETVFETEANNLSLLYELCSTIQSDSFNATHVTSNTLMNNVFSNIHYFILNADEDEQFQYFNEFYYRFDSRFQFYNCTIEACVLTSLCHFFTHTKKIKSLSISEFLKKNFEEKFDLKKGNSDITSEANRLRKARHRLLSGRDVYVERGEWSAIPESSEYELSLLEEFYLSNDEDIEILYETYKRIGNLYNDINKSFTSSTKNNERLLLLINSTMKFKRKVARLKYDKVLKLAKFLTDKICANKDYYGINLYRFERTLRLHNITYEVNKLLECDNEFDEFNLLHEYSVLNNVHFTSVYHKFREIDNLQEMTLITTAFTNYLKQFVISSQLIIDKLIDDGYFGSNWESLFLEIINEMADKVFYTSDNIEYSTTAKSQEKFEKLLLNNVAHLVSSEVYRTILNK